MRLTSVLLGFALALVFASIPLAQDLVNADSEAFQEQLKHREVRELENLTRSIALVTGVFFNITIVVSIRGLLLYGPLLNGPNCIIGKGFKTSPLLDHRYQTSLNRMTEA